MSDDKIKTRFGVAGFPSSFFETKYKKDRANGPEWLHELGLDALEVQFVHGPRMKEEKAKEYRENAEKFGITLTCHGSYYTVLSSPKPDVIDASLKRLEQTCRLASILGSQRVVLHPGATYGDRESAMDRFLTNMNKFAANSLPDDVFIHVETAGKNVQLGTLEEILHICREIPKCRPCVDFGHLHARQLSEVPSDKGWSFNEVDDFVHALNYLKQNMLPEHWPHTHYHMTPIQFGAKGEIRHRDHGELVAPEDASPLFGDAGELWKPVAEQFAEALAMTGAPAIVISEASDSMDRGAMAMKQAYLNALSG